MVDLPPPVAFTQADADAAWDSWGCNCGPGAVAGVLGLTLDQVRPHLGDFETKRYTAPTLMWAILRSLRVRFSLMQRKDWPRYGLARIQWEGPWTRPGVPMAARYRHTHWVGSCWHPGRGQGVFDINCMNNGSGWAALADWEGVIVPALTAEIRRADGKWHITHAVPIERWPGGALHG